MAFRVQHDHQGSLFFEGINRRFATGLVSANRRAAEIMIDGISKTALATFETNSTDGLAGSFYLANVSRSGAIILSTKVYAGVHETGRVIHAKNGPYLTYKLRDGTWRRTRSVVIPATHYISRGVESKRAELEAWARTYLTLVTEGARMDARI